MEWKSYLSKVNCYKSDVICFIYA